VNWVDVIIILVVVGAAIRGFFVGAIRQIFGLIGLVAGFILGVAIAPALSSDVTHANWRPLLALVIIMLIAALGSALGSALGNVVAKFAHAILLGLVDRVAGAVVSFVAALLFCWLVAGVLATVTWNSVATQIQNSNVLRAVDTFMPPVPSIEAKVQSLFPNASLPGIFAKIVAPTLAPIVKPDQLGPLVVSLKGPSDVQKVFASGACNNTSEATAFFVGPHEAITNAHVVAGQRDITVDAHAATVAYFDPLNDLAVLRVPGLTETPLRFVRHEPSAGAAISVIGYPLDSSRTGAPGYVEGSLTGLGRDIYNQTIYSKTVEVLEVNINPGNSGSPVLDGGYVAGVIESKSLSVASTAYAIPISIVEADLAKTPRTGVASTQACYHD
jgi:S1-C subfamily serine protease